MDAASRIQILLGYVNDDPGDAFTKYILALEYIKLGNDAEALKWLEIVYKSHPDYLPNYYHYGKLLERNGNIDKAIQIYSEGMNLAQTTNDQHTFLELKGAYEMLVM